MLQVVSRTVLCDLHPAAAACLLLVAGVGSTRVHSTKPTEFVDISDVNFVCQLFWLMHPLSLVLGNSTANPLFLKLDGDSRLISKLLSGI